MARQNANIHVQFINSVSLITAPSTVVQVSHSELISNMFFIENVSHIEFSL